MANDINVFNFSGRLTRNAEFGTTTNDKQYLRFSIAVNSYYNNENHASFFNIVVWGRSAEYLSDKLMKGMLVSVTGKIANNNWTDKQGNKRRGNNFIANQVVFNPSDKDENEEEGF